MKIVFMGTPKAAAISLDRLIADGHDIVAAYTQPDRPAGRGKHVSMSPVKEFASAHGLVICQPVKLKSPEALAEFRSYAADIAVVVAYGRILPGSFLTAFHRGALNVHFSLLPKYRGAAPVNWAIVNGETETGVTTMQMDEGLDTGNILLQRPIPIGARENALELMDRLARIGADLLSETLVKMDSIEPLPQDDAAATFAPILRKEDGLIDWRRSAVDIERRVRGFQPFPTSYTFNRAVRLTIWAAEAVNSTQSTTLPGTVVRASSGELIIASGGGSALSVLELQPEGRRRMFVRDYLNGSHLVVGDLLGTQS